MDRCRDAFPVRLMCRCLHVSPSGYYSWRSRPLSRRAKENQRLLQEIRELHTASDGVAGSPGIWRDLRYRGETVSLNRVARLMRSAGLRGIPQKKRWKQKQPGQRPAMVENVIARDFQATQANTKWATDITYIETGEGWLFLSMVKDMYAGEVVGWSMSPRQDRQLVIQAVLMALWQRPGREPVILHSDRGTQFTSDEYQRFLKGHNLICSMSGVGSCADNATAESFFGVMKRERVNRRRYRTRGEARKDIFDYIERVYNPRKRRQLKLRQEREALLSKPSAESG